MNKPRLLQLKTYCNISNVHDSVDCSASCYVWLCFVKYRLWYCWKTIVSKAISWTLRQTSHRLRFWLSFVFLATDAISTLCALAPTTAHLCQAAVRASAYGTGKPKNVFFYMQHWSWVDHGKHLIMGWQYHSVFMVNQPQTVVKVSTWT